MADTLAQTHGAPQVPAHGPAADPEGGGTRRDFLYLTTAAFAAVGVGAVVVPFIASMNPSRDVLALSTTEVDLSPIAVGSAVTVVWRGKPVFIRHRTEKEIQEARAVPLSELKDPEPDQARVKKDEWLVMLGVCTHLGCVPLGEAGDFGGWFCPCHGSHYDTAGRIRKGPAPRNLAIPVVAFVDPGTIQLG